MRSLTVLHRQTEREQQKETTHGYATDLRKLKPEKANNTRRKRDKQMWDQKPLWQLFPFIFLLVARNSWVWARRSPFCVFFCSPSIVSLVDQEMSASGKGAMASLYKMVKTRGKVCLVVFSYQCSRFCSFFPSTLPCCCSPLPLMRKSLVHHPEVKQLCLLLFVYSMIWILMNYKSLPIVNSSCLTKVNPNTSLSFPWNPDLCECYFW